MCRAQGSGVSHSSCLCSKAVQISSKQPAVEINEAVVAIVVITIINYYFYCRAQATGEYWIKFL